MRLDELNWRPESPDSNWVMADVMGYVIYKPTPNNTIYKDKFFISKPAISGFNAKYLYRDLDKIEAQAVLYHLLSEVSEENTS
jgi:hypothetical protein